MHPIHDFRQYNNLKTYFRERCLFGVNLSNVNDVMEKRCKPEHLKHQRCKSKDIALRRWLGRIYFVEELWRHESYRATSLRTERGTRENCLHIARQPKVAKQDLFFHRNKDIFL